jgi:cyclophilin family peptidyl-prolyl cis-trans isomerase
MQAASVLKQLIDQYPNQIRLVYRNFSVGHALSNIAIQAAEAADLQGKYWEMHNVLFNEATWQTWDSMAEADFIIWVTEQAATLGMDTTKFAADLKSTPIVDKVTADTNAAVAAGLNSTPSMFVLFNNDLYFAPADQLPFTYLPAIFQLWQLQTRQFKACPPTTIDTSKTYTATLTTSKGDIVIELFAQEAPTTVNAFVFLAQQGWYSNVPFHRVIDGFVAQTGDPTGTGLGGPGFQVGNDIVSTLNFDAAGMVGMANSGAGTNGSQFFITLAPATALDTKYTVFGKVTQGLDVLAKLTRVDPANPTTPPTTPDTLISVTITVK